MHWDKFRLFASHISPAASAVCCRVSIQELSPKSSRRYSDAIFLPRNRRKVTHHEDGVFRRLSLAQQRNHAGQTVVTIHPLEPRRIGVQFMHSFFVAVELV